MIRSQRKELHEIPRPSVRPSVRGNRLPADANLELTEESHFHALHRFDNHTALGDDKVERVVVEREPLASGWPPSASQSATFDRTAKADLSVRRAFWNVCSDTP